MTLTYVMKLGFTTRKYDIGIQKIDSSILVTYGIVIARFFVQDKLEKIQFFEKTFLLADTSMEVILKMLFLTFFDVTI